MGRRKQHCPQKTGPGGEALSSPGEGGVNPSVDEDGIGQNDSASVSEGSDRDSKEAAMMSTLESLEGTTNRNNGLSPRTSLSLSSPQASLSNYAAAAASATAAQAATAVGLGLGVGVPSAAAATTLTSTSAYEPEMVAAMMKNPLLNPLLAAGLNNPLYAVQLAQLQAAQLLSQTHQQLTAARRSPESGEEVLSNLRKRKAAEEEAAMREGLNLSKKSPRPRVDSPLDLSAVGMSSLSPMKVPKMDSGGGMAAWAAAAGAFPFLSPFLAAGTAADAARLSAVISPPTMTTSSATTLQDMLSAGRTANPLDQMSEIAKTGSGSRASSAGQRHSAWQSQWINRGPENTKDIFKCVWCKESFITLQALTSHMRETKHFGPNIPASAASATTGAVGMAGQLQMSRTPPLSSMVPASSPKQVHIPPPPPPPPSVPMPGRSPSSSSSSAVATASPAKRDILKEQLPLPRKLVRGQDVWLGKGEQQTRDILKCMWCGESFRSLDLMTRHMQETKHYTKVISQEQLVSWKSGDGPPPSTPSASGPSAAATSAQNDNGGNHVSSVLTCKVCDVPFSTLKDLSEHMVKNNHYKDGQAQGREPHTSSSPPLAVRPPTSSQSQQDAAAAIAAAPMMTTAVGQSHSQTKEKRKKSLPVRKLLELERAQQEVSGQLKHAEDAAAAGKISCEKCGERIVMQLFVDHIRQCVGPLPIQRPSIPADSPPKRTTLSEQHPQKESSIAASSGAASASEEPKSILGSLEKMVQNNFGSKKKAETNLSILQRLGIDEGVDYSKPLVDPMALFRPHTSAAAAAAVAFSFLPPAAAAAAAAQFAASEGTNSKTRSSSECSSPDRYRAEAVSAGHLTPVTEPKSRSPAAAESPGSEKIMVKSPSPELNCMSKEDTRSDVGSVRGSDKEKGIAGNDSRSNSASPAANSNPPSPGRNATPKSTNGGDGDAPKGGEGDDDDTAHSSTDTKKNKKKSHPLAALQMLCDKTESTKKGQSKGQQPESLSNSVPTADPGSILAFSWACNQAVVNDSMLKCPFCDTPFISKGAYRHHLSKMHFVKDGTSPDPKMMFGKTPAETGNSKCPTPTGNGSGSTSGSDKEENAQSKFQKYSQLAKQLSCAGQP